MKMLKAIFDGKRVAYLPFNIDPCALNVIPLPDMDNYVCARKRKRVLFVAFEPDPISVPISVDRMWHNTGEGNTCCPVFSKFDVHVFEAKCPILLNDKGESYAYIGKDTTYYNTYYKTLKILSLDVSHPVIEVDNKTYVALFAEELLADTMVKLITSGLTSYLEKIQNSIMETDGPDAHRSFHTPFYEINSSPDKYRIFRFRIYSDAAFDDMLDYEE